MFRKVFSNQQLSSFFQLAILMQLISLMTNLIIYHYFPEQDIVDNAMQLLNEISLFMMCLVIISQSISLFISKYKNFVERHTFIALTSIVSMSMVIFWVLAIDNDIQEEFIIFLSKTSLIDHSYELIAMLITIFMILLYDFYHTIKDPETINDKTVPEILKSAFRLVIKEHLFIFISLFGAFEIKKIHTFASMLLQYTKTSIMTDFTFLEILIPITWLIAIIYYIFDRFQTKSLKPQH
ncbi:hypothetical protein KBC04_04265 [Candidatus Babeliales bacterium]|nr:hypothetical protein [Candidatus Babeliales bacterium]MBP9844280.1 hypothetical protein [Candidatus Babeliales bacterium]